MRYLVFIEVGGAMEDDGYCYYCCYTICEGNSETEAIKDWEKKNDFNDCDLYQRENGEWAGKGFTLQIVPLYKTVPNHDTWNKLKWVKA